MNNFYIMEGFKVKMNRYHSSLSMSNISNGSKLEHNHSACSCLRCKPFPEPYNNNTDASKEMFVDWGTLPNWSRWNACMVDKLLSVFKID